MQRITGKRPPKHWEEAYRLMKDSIPPEVSVLSIEDTPNFPIDRSPAAKQARFQVLIGLILSSQTKDSVSSAAEARLHSLDFSVSGLRKTAEKDLSDLIYPVRFYLTKARQILSTTEIIHEDYEDDVPDTLEGLLTLPGVGKKIGFLCLQMVGTRQCFKKVEGIAVDTHVHRVCNRLGWTNSRSPEETRTQLQNWVPRSEWVGVDQTLLYIGQTLCPAKNPKCLSCPVQSICQTGKKLGPKKPSKRPKT